MPLYEYQCDACEHRFERIQKFSDPPIDACPVCAGAVKKLLSSPAIQFKGSGWYITDYAKKPASGDTKPGASAKESSSEGGGSGASASSKESKDSKESTESKDSKDSKDSKAPTPKKD